MREESGKWSQDGWHPNEKGRRFQVKNARVISSLESRKKKDVELRISGRSSLHNLMILYENLMNNEIRSNQISSRPLMVDMKCTTMRFASSSVLQIRQRKSMSTWSSTLLAQLVKSPW